MSGLFVFTCDTDVTLSLTEGLNSHSISIMNVEVTR